MEYKNCEVCGKTFFKRINCSKFVWSKSKYCSIKCRFELKGEYFNCLICGKEFYRPKSHLYNNKFCSYKCQGLSKVGKPNFYNKDKGHTVTFNCDECKKEVKQKWGIYYQDKKNHFCSLKCSNTFLGKNNSGKNHWNWKGGITPVYKALRHSPQYNEWRKSVYKRDFWTCRVCETKQKHPIAHHIKNFREYPELRFEVSNGITLCRSCHKKLHGDIGIDSRFRSSVIMN